jgi:hypothetical protein
MTLLISPDSLTVALIDRGVRRACSVCGGSSAECLCCSQVSPVLLCEDTERGSGRIEGLVDDCPTDSTVKQEALSREQWIRWSHGLSIDDDIEIMPIESRLLAIVHPAI